MSWRVFATDASQPDFDELNDVERSALADDLPGRAGKPGGPSNSSIDAFVASAARDMEEARLTDPLILVGHSMAGLILPGMAARLARRTAHLVFVAASIPPEGQSLVDTLPLVARAATRRAVKRAEGPIRAMPRRLIRALFCNDMTREQQTRVIENFVPEAPAALLEPASRNSMPKLPTTYIRFSRDRSVRPRTALRMVDNLGGADVIDLDAGHDGMITQPAAVARVLNQVADQVRAGSP